MREGGLRFAMHTSQRRMPAIVPGGATMRRKASAARSTNSTYSTITTQLNRPDNVDVLKDTSHCQGQETCTMSASDSDVAADSDSSGSGVSGDVDSVMEDDYEVIDNRNFQSIARMNVNSNGKTKERGKTKEGKTHSVKEPEADNIEINKQSKQLTVGATPLEPVGLSLSSSGVQLYMMVNPDEKQKLLANAKVQLDIGGRKKRMRNNNFNTTNTKTDEVSSNPNSGLQSWTNINMDVMDCKNDVTCHSESQRVGVLASRNGFDTVGDTLQTGTTSRLLPAPENRKRTYVCNSQEQCIESSCRTKIPVTENLLHGQGRGLEALSHQAGPSWRFDNEEINDRNFEDSKKMLRHQDEKEGHQRMDKEYIYAEPKDKYIVRQSRDFVMNHNDHHVNGCHVDKRTKHNSCQDYVSNAVGLSQPHYRNSSSDEDEDMSYQDEICPKNASEMKKRMMTTQVTHGKHAPPGRRRTIDEPSMTEDRIINEHSHQRQAIEEASSSTTVFHTSQQSSSALDATKMAKFTEYTENMRKNMKQDYKNLSHLIKSFNDDVHEKNNNQSSQSRSNVDQSEKAQKTKNTKDRCLLM